MPLKRQGFLRENKEMTLVKITEQFSRRKKMATDFALKFLKMVGDR